MIIVNDLRPVFPFVTQIDGLMVQIKPFYSYYRWMDWIDLSGLDQSASIEAIEASIAMLNTAVIETFELATDAVGLATDASVTAIDALNNAATAQAAAEAAQATANAAADDYGNCIFLTPQATHTITGGFAPFVVNTAYALNGGCLMAGLNSEVSFAVGLCAGNYVVRLNGAKLPSGADVSLYVDGALHSTNHFYSATTVPNTIITYVVNSLSKAVHVFGLKITGRQPANTTGYNLYLSYIEVSPNP
jgi:hypothetical protein